MFVAARPIATQPLLEMCNVSKRFQRSRASAVDAVRSVSLRIMPGETVALVGESGSGKTTLGRIALGLIKPDSGWVMLDQRRLDQLSRGELRAIRCSMQPVFQDATAALNPRRSVAQHMLQALGSRSADALGEAVALLDSVGLRPGAAYLPRLPHELSGGQRQRLTIARALAPRPRLIIADEPLSGADVSIRGQILNLLLDIRQNRGIALLLIVHDIMLARAFADRVAVMREGTIVETGDVARVFGNPQHDYTRRLLAAVPTLP